MPHESVVYVVDDDRAMRDSLGFLLEATGFSVALFESAAAFLDRAPTLGSGCVVTDVQMPGMNGMDLLRRLKADRSTLPVVVMTGHGDIPLAVEAIRLGAFEFLEKPFGDKQLIEAIRTAVALGKESAKNEAIASDLSNRVAGLSQRERQVMDGLVAGLSNKLIARDYDISPRTIEVYRANVMTKMQARSLSELVRLALRAGLLDG
jgi:two-component system response regulator FixJ